FPTEPPKPTRLAPVRFPPFKEATLPNGLALVVIEHHEQPVVSVSLAFRAGAIYDPAGKEGLSELTAELLSKGTATRTAEQIASTIEGVGGHLSASSADDFLTISVDALSDQLELVFDLLGDVTLHSTFPTSELARHAAVRPGPATSPHAARARHPAGAPAGLGTGEHRRGQSDHSADRPGLLRGARRRAGTGRRGGLTAVPHPARAEELDVRRV